MTLDPNGRRQAGIRPSVNRQDLRVDADGEPVRIGLSRPAGERSYFHGGVPGLKLGDRILPPTRTGAVAAADRAAALGIDTRYVRRDRVYLTDQLELAAGYAVIHPSNRGAVYVVEPLPPLEPDPDYIGNADHAWQAAEATIVRCLGPVGPDVAIRIRADLMRIATSEEFGRRLALARRSSGPHGGVAGAVVNVIDAVRQ